MTLTINLPDDEQALLAAKAQARGVTTEEYAEFYKHISHDWEAPLKTMTFKAEGRFEFPADLPATDSQRLRRQVQALLRDRLIRFIARAVAHFLLRATDQVRATDQDPDSEVPPHA